MARIPLDPACFDRRPNLLTRLLLRTARRRFGATPDSVLAMSHHPGVLGPWTLLEAANLRRRTVLPPHLADLVVFVAAARIGCSWCVDFGAALWERQGLDPATLRRAVQWRDAGGFDPATRAALAYTEAVCEDVTLIPDSLVEQVRSAFGDAGLVEITYLAALENMRSRFNGSLGLTAQGFSSGAACDLASAQRQVSE